jgi:signal transduction histidine kinase
MAFAHDLRQPLRSIVMTTQRIQRNTAATELGPETMTKLDEVLAAARKQEELIASAVECEQARETGLAADTLLSLKLVLQTACLKVDAFRQSQAGTVHIPEPAAMPQRMAPAGVARVIEKVLHNSLKFHLAGAPPVVVIAISEDAATGMIEMRISDQGLGIDPQYRQAVFEPFKRLNPASDYPGSGLGLPTSRRLIESIQLEDGPNGRGLTAVVRFPASPAAS